MGSSPATQARASRLNRLAIFTRWLVYQRLSDRREIRLGSVVVAVAGQVICDPHECASQPAIGVPDEGAPIVVGLIALMPGRVKSAATRDRIGVGVPRDRSHFGGKGRPLKLH